MRTSGLYLRNRGLKKHPEPAEIQEISLPINGTPVEEYLTERIPEIDISSIPCYSVGWIPIEAELVLHQDMAAPPENTIGFAVYFFNKPSHLLANNYFSPASAELEALTMYGLPEKRWRKTYGDGIGNVCETQNISNKKDFLLLSEGALSSIAALLLWQETEEILPDRVWGYGWAQNGHRVDLSGWDHITTIADGDKAGRKAASKIAAMYNANVWEMPDGHDAADIYAKKYSE